MNPNQTTRYDPLRMQPDTDPFQDDSSRAQWEANSFATLRYPDAGSSPQCATTESAATPEARLAAAIGGWVHEALRGEGLVVVERGSARDLWLDALNRASHQEPSAVPALIAAGDRQGWLA